MRDHVTTDANLLLEKFFSHELEPFLKEKIRSLSKEPLYFYHKMQFQT